MIVFVIYKHIEIFYKFFLFVFSVHVEIFIPSVRFIVYALKMFNFKESIIIFLIGYLNICKYRVIDKIYSKNNFKLFNVFLLIQ